MDVAIVAAARFPIEEPFAGGMEAHTHVLADSLAGRGHGVTVYAAGGQGRFTTRPMAAGFSASATARRDVSAGHDDRLAEHHCYLDVMVELAGRDHDVVHINATHHLPFACASLLSSRVTGTLHSPPTPWLESALTLAAGRPNTPRLASVSRTNARAWTAVPVERVIPNGVDLDRWTPGPGGDAAIWTGRIVPEKGTHLAINACRAAGMELRIMGPIHDERYFERCVEPHLGDGVEYLGHGSHAELAAAVGRSRVAVVSPCWDEPFGLVVIEALACGTPVAALARGALPELVTDDVGALAADEAALAGAIHEAATRDRTTCRARAERSYAADRMVDRYEAWFAAVVAA